MTTPVNNIPWVPENTQDPAAGLNDALRIIDALLQCAVIDMSQTSPPGSPADGDQYIVASGATGAWSGNDGRLARWVAIGGFWEFYDPTLVVNKDDSGLYLRDPGGWSLAAGLGDAPHTGDQYAREDGAWVVVSGGGDTDTLPVAIPSNSGGIVTLDFAGQSHYVGSITLSANVSTLSFSNLPGSGKFAEYELHIKQDGTGGRTFSIPGSHKPLGDSATAIAAAANAVTVLAASTVDNGSSWRYAMAESA